MYIIMILALLIFTNISPAEQNAIYHVTIKWRNINALNKSNHAIPSNQIHKTVTNQVNESICIETSLEHFCDFSKYKIDILNYKIDSNTKEPSFHKKKLNISTNIHRVRDISIVGRKFKESFNSSVDSIRVKINDEVKKMNKNLKTNNLQLINYNYLPASSSYNAKNTTLRIAPTTKSRMVSENLSKKIEKNESLYNLSETNIKSLLKRSIRASEMFEELDCEDMFGTGSRLCRHGNMNKYHVSGMDVARSLVREEILKFVAEQEIKDHNSVDDEPAEEELKIGNQIWRFHLDNIITHFNEKLKLYEKKLRKKKNTYLKDREQYKRLLARVKDKREDLLDNYKEKNNKIKLMCKRLKTKYAKIERRYTYSFEKKRFILAKIKQKNILLQKRLNAQLATLHEKRDNFRTIEDMIKEKLNNVLNQEKNKEHEACRVQLRYIRMIKKMIPELKTKIKNKRRLQNAWQQGLLKLNEENSYVKDKERQLKNKLKRLNNDLILKLKINALMTKENEREINKKYLKLKDSLKPRLKLQSMNDEMFRNEMLNFYKNISLFIELREKYFEAIHLRKIKELENNLLFEKKNKTSATNIQENVTAFKLQNIKMDGLQKINESDLKSRKIQENLLIKSENNLSLKKNNETKDIQENITDFKLENIKMNRSQKINELDRKTSKIQENLLMELENNKETNVKNIQENLTDFKLKKIKINRLQKINESDLKTKRIQENPIIESENKSSFEKNNENKFKNIQENSTYLKLQNLKIKGLQKINEPDLKMKKIQEDQLLLKNNKNISNNKIIVKNIRRWNINKFLRKIEENEKKLAVESDLKIKKLNELIAKIELMKNKTKKSKQNMNDLKTIKKKIILINNKNNENFANTIKLIEFMKMNITEYNYKNSEIKKMLKHKINNVMHKQKKINQENALISQMLKKVANKRKSKLKSLKEEKLNSSNERNKTSPLIKEKWLNLKGIKNKMDTQKRKKNLKPYININKLILQMNLNDKNNTNLTSKDINAQKSQIKKGNLEANKISNKIDAKKKHNEINLNIKNDILNLTPNRKKKLLPLFEKTKFKFKSNNVNSKDLNQKERLVNVNNAKASKIKNINPKINEKNNKSISIIKNPLSKINETVNKIVKLKEKNKNESNNIDNTNLPALKNKKSNTNKITNKTVEQKINIKSKYIEKSNDNNLIVKNTKLNSNKTDKTTKWNQKAKEKSNINNEKTVYKIQNIKQILNKTNNKIVKQKQKINNNKTVPQIQASILMSNNTNEIIYQMKNQNLKTNNTFKHMATQNKKNKSKEKNVNIMNSTKNKETTSIKNNSKIDSQTNIAKLNINKKTVTNIHDKHRKSNITNKKIVIQKNKPKQISNNKNILTKSKNTQKIKISNDILSNNISEFQLSLRKRSINESNKLANFILKKFNNKIVHQNNYNFVNRKKRNVKCVKVYRNKIKYCYMGIEDGVQLKASIKDKEFLLENTVKIIVKKLILMHMDKIRTRKLKRYLNAINKRKKINKQDRLWKKLFKSKAYNFLKNKLKIKKLYQLFNSKENFIKRIYKRLVKKYKGNIINAKTHYRHNLQNLQVTGNKILDKIIILKQRKLKADIQLKLAINAEKNEHKLLEKKFNQKLKQEKTILQNKKLKMIKLWMKINFALKKTQLKIKILNKKMMQAKCKYERVLKLINYLREKNHTMEEDYRKKLKEYMWKYITNEHNIKNNFEELYSKLMRKNNNSLKNISIFKIKKLIALNKLVKTKNKLKKKIWNNTLKSLKLLNNNINQIKIQVKQKEEKFRQKKHKMIQKYKKMQDLE